MLGIPEGAGVGRTGLCVKAGEEDAAGKGFLSVTRVEGGNVGKGAAEDDALIISDYFCHLICCCKHGLSSWVTGE